MTTTHTADLSIRMTIPHYGDKSLDVIVEYTYHARPREVDINAVVIEVGGAEISVMHHLTRSQLAEIVDACREDYYARMESAVETRRRNREYDAWA